MALPVTAMAAFGPTTTHTSTYDHGMEKQAVRGWACPVAAPQDGVRQTAEMATAVSGTHRVPATE